MAKKKTVHPIHMHVPTKIGFTIVGIAVMVYGLFLASSYTADKRADTIMSHAAVISGTQQSGPHKCISNNCASNACAQYKKGTCYNISKHTCSTGYLKGYCPGGPNIRCCPRR